MPKERLFIIVLPWIHHSRTLLGASNIKGRSKGPSTSPSFAFIIITNKKQCNKELKNFRKFSSTLHLWKSNFIASITPPKRGFCRCLKVNYYLLNNSF